MWNTRGPPEMSFVEIESYLYYLLILLFLMAVPNPLHTVFYFKTNSSALSMKQKYGE